MIQQGMLQERRYCLSAHFLSFQRSRIQMRKDFLDPTSVFVAGLAGYRDGHPGICRLIQSQSPLLECSQL